MAVSHGDRASRFEVREVPESDGARLREGHALLREEMLRGEVEPLDEFMKTVSPTTGGTVVPVMVRAMSEAEMIGFNVGLYLRDVNVGFIAYSAVRPRWRRLGVYTAMRALLVAAMQRGAAGRGRGQLDYVVSELDESSPLLRPYLDELNALVASCAYEQPAVQGLASRRLKLVLQPLGKRGLLRAGSLLDIVGEIYRSVYRISNVLDHPAYRRVAASLDLTALVVAR